MPSDVNLGVRSPKGLLPLRGSKLQLRFPIARDHAVTHTFCYLSMPLLATNWAPVVCGWLRRANRPPGLPARLGTPADLRSTSIRGRGFAAYLSACGGQLFIVRCAHYARGASLSTFGFVTIVPRYLLPQVIPSHSFAARTRACCAPRKWRRGLTYMPRK